MRVAAVFILAISPCAFGVDFAHDVAPILEQHCVKCHQTNIKKGELSFSTAAELLKSGVIDFDAPEQSRLLAVIRPGKDGAPPEMPKKGVPLTPEETTILHEWVREGASWPDGLMVKEQSKADRSWWSLQALADVVPPVNQDLPKAWQQNPIDRFVGATLRENNLHPSPESDKRTLIRRLYFDLLGLPPTFEAVQSFVDDTRPGAYERLVDALLASPHYGERWARHWLDIAHYADTHGFERDQRRDNAYRYRDYVIQAFNEDKPYDTFLREQIAGDALWPNSSEAIIATGFLAAGPWDYVGQVETKSPKLRRAARADDLDDMVTTVMTATMGLTLNCARCHDHKLDPISQKEYYQLAAVFAGTTRAERSASPEYDAAQERISEVDAALTKLEQRAIDLADIVGGGDGFGSDTPHPSGIDVRTGDRVSDSIGTLTDVHTNHYTLVPSSKFIDGVVVPSGEGPTAVSSTGITIDDLPPTSGATWDHVLNGPVKSQDSTEIDGIDFTTGPHSMIGIHANKAITFDLQALRDSHGVGRLRFSAIVGYGGRNPDTSADCFVYVEDKLRAARRGFGASDGGRSVEFDVDPDEQFLTLIATDGGNGIGYDQVFFGDPRLIIHPEDTARSSEAQTMIDALRVERAQLVAAHPPSENSKRVFAVVSQTPPTSHVLMRGDPESPGEKVLPGALSCLDGLSPFKTDEELGDLERRAALAAWITASENPLTPRVWVNRLWHHHFGVGIVDTPSDFGYGGGHPSHPALLDWLAAELKRNDWSTKAIHRLILTSQTYRQESSFSPSYDLDRYADPRAIDADNRLLWRMNPRRLDAESLRDSVLEVAGTLNREAFGPGFRDFDYEEEYAPKYSYVTADSPELWRRSVYRFVVRTSPQPFMSTLDCPNPAVLTPARLKTTTALQSLALLNNELMLKQSQYFADRVQEVAGNAVDAQIVKAYRTAFAREPSDLEREQCRALVDARGLAALCRVLFNANEFVHID